MKRHIYACNVLRGTTKFAVDDVAGARFPAEAAERFCEELSDSGAFAFCDGDSVDVTVTVDGKAKIKCNVIVSVETKIVRKFTGIEAGQNS